jgi:uncharacterized alpha-E superfamily protein
VLIGGEGSKGIMEVRKELYDASCPGCLIRGWLSKSSNSGQGQRKISNTLKFLKDHAEREEGREESERERVRERVSADEAELSGLAEEREAAREAAAAVRYQSCWQYSLP